MTTSGTVASPVRIGVSYHRQASKPGPIPFAASRTGHLAI
jgi:hypothetical protein